MDHSVSVVPSSRLKSPVGLNIEQKWPDRVVYRGSILEESGIVYLAQKCVSLCSVLKQRFTGHQFIIYASAHRRQELEKRLKELCKLNSPKKQKRPQKRTSNTQKDFQYTENNPPKNTKWSQKEKLKLAEIQRAHARQSGCLARKVRERGAQ